MIRFFIILLIGKSMTLKLPEEFVDNERIERAESTIYELLNIIKFTDTLNVKEKLLTNLKNY